MVMTEDQLITQTLVTEELMLDNQNQQMLQDHLLEKTSNSCLNRMMDLEDQGLSFNPLQILQPPE